MNQNTTKFALTSNSGESGEILSSSEALFVFRRRQANTFARIIGESDTQLAP
jgi:hypothetical protein